MKLDTVLQNFSLPFKNQRGTFFRPHFQSSANNRTLMPTYETTCSMRYKLLFLHSTADKIPVSRAQAMNRNLMENKSTIHINSRSTDLLVIKNCRTVVNTDAFSSRSAISPRTQLITQHKYVLHSQHCLHRVSVLLQSCRYSVGLHDIYQNKVKIVIWLAMITSRMLWYEVYALRVSEWSALEVVYTIRPF